MDIFKETSSPSKPRSKMKADFRKRNGGSSPFAVTNSRPNRRLPQPPSVKPAIPAMAPLIIRSCSFIRRCSKSPNKKALSSRSRRIRSRLQRLLQHSDLTSVIGIVLSDADELCICRVRWRYYQRLLKPIRTECAESLSQLFVQLAK